MRKFIVLFVALVSMANTVSAQKTFENNPLMQENIKCWIHFLKTAEYVDSDSASEYINDVSEAEMRMAYVFLENEFDVWIYSLIIMFDTNLMILRDKVRDKEVDLNNLKYVRLDKKARINLRFGISDQSMSDEEYELRSIEAVNTAYVIKKAIGL